MAKKPVDRKKGAARRKSLAPRAPKEIGVDQAEQVRGGRKAGEGQSKDFMLIKLKETF